MSLNSRISDLITAIGTDYKELRTWITGSSGGDLTGLTTMDKTSLRNAINEVKAEVGAATIPDASVTVKGKIEIATLAEVATGTDTARAVTPEGVAQQIAGVTIPDASETVKGKVEMATLAEATAGSDTTRAVTPAGVTGNVNAAVAAAAVPDASTTVKGKVELASLPEVATGTDQTRAVTPEGVAQQIATVTTPDASTTVKGKIEIATLAEVATGIDTARAVTPEGVKQERDAIVTAERAVDASETVNGHVELATLVEMATGTDPMRVATVLGVRQERAALKAEILGAGVPAALDTLDELAAALADDAAFSATVVTSLAGKQPLDSDLTAIAALVSAADKMPYATGAGAWALSTVTSAARGLLDDADVATMRATLSVYSQAEIGDPDTDLVALYTTAKA